MAKIIGLPDGTEGEFPDDMSDDEIASVLKSQFPPSAAQPVAAQPQQPIARKYLKEPEKSLEERWFPETSAYVNQKLASLPNWLLTGNKQIRGVVKGAGDPTVGSAQLLANVVGQGGGLNQWVKDEETKYQQRRGDDGIDWSRGVGNVISPANLMLASKLPVAATLLGRTGQGAGLGAMSGLMNPETGENYGMDKAKSVGIGTVAGGVLPGIGSALKYGVKEALPAIISGFGTRTGSEGIKQAFKAGAKGGEDFSQYLKNLRGEGSADDLVEMARNNLSKMDSDMKSAYRSGMVDIKKDQEILKFDKIDDALKAVRGRAYHKDMNDPINKVAANAYDEITEMINKFKSDPQKYGKVEDFDALKRAVYGIVDSIPINEKTARGMGSEVFNAIKDTIIEQAPAYAKVMKGYEEGSNALRELEKTLSLGKNTMPDTAIRKLQSVMRNNVNSNYGKRTELVDKMIAEGGNDIMPTLAGQSLSSLAPRSLGGGTAGGAITAGSFWLNPLLGMAVLGAQSPRVVGELAGGLGALSRYPKQFGKYIAEKTGTAPMIDKAASGIAPVSENMRVAPGLASVINDQRRR